MFSSPFSKGIIGDFILFISGIFPIFSNTFISNQYFFNSCFISIASSLSSNFEKILILKPSLNKFGELNIKSEYFFISL
jgi:hypothetical protein